MDVSEEKLKNFLRFQDPSGEHLVNTFFEKSTNFISYLKDFKSLSHSEKSLHRTLINFFLDKL